MNTLKATAKRENNGTIIIESLDSLFSGKGKSIKEAREEMILCMMDFKKLAIKKNMKYPPFLDDEFVIEILFDVKSFLEFYNGIISLAALESISGIHQKQLWNYLHTDTKPRKKQIERLMSAIADFSQELSVVRIK